MFFLSETRDRLDGIWRPPYGVGPDRSKKMRSDILRISGTWRFSMGVRQNFDSRNSAISTEFQGEGALKFDQFNQFLGSRHLKLEPSQPNSREKAL